MARAARVAQTGVLTLALTPVARDRSRKLLRVAGPAAAVAQQCALLALLGGIAGPGGEGECLGEVAVSGRVTRRR